MLIKVCGLKQPENFRGIQELGPDLVGLIFFNGSERCIDLTPEHFAVQCIQRVGVFVNASISQIENASVDFRLHYIQLHGNESPEFCSLLKDKGYKLIKAFSIDQLFDFSIVDHYASSCEMALFDTRGKKRGGNGKSFNWSLLKKYNGHLPFLLSGGIDLHHVERIRAIDHPQFKGVDINSCFELSPGVKDKSKVQEFINQIRNSEVCS